MKATVKKSGNVKPAAAKANPAKKLVATAKKPVKTLAKPKAATKAKSVIKPQSKVATKPVAKPKAVTKAKPVIKPQSKVAAKPPVKAVAKPVAKKSAQVAAKPAPKPVSKSPKTSAKLAPKKVSVPLKISKPVPKSAPKPVAKTIAKAPAKTPVKLVAQPAVKVAAKAAPAAKVAAKVAAKAPVAKTAAPAKAVAPAVAAAPAVATKIATATTPPAPAVKPRPSKYGANSPGNIAPKAMEASTAAKTNFTMSAPVLVPPPQLVVKKDPKLINNWKTQTAAQLTDAEAIAMPDAQYMSALQLAFFRLKLVQLKTDILNSAGKTTENLREDSSVVPDPADRATIEEEHALELRTRDRERKLLKKIEQSISRIDSDDYGYCDETGEAIGVARLIARPTASLSLEAQQRRELKQKMFGD